MMRSMFAGVSGLRNHQVRMDVIGNNIANVNTVGYKTSRVTFADALSQTLRGATAPQGNRGGINPQQVGLGVTLSSIDVLHTPGNLQTTGVNTDLAIQGNGFFILSDGVQRYYTRAGNFSMDTAGYLVYFNGLKLQGWLADSNGVINTNGQIGELQLPINSTIAPQPTTEVTLTGNLQASGTQFTRNIEVIDSLGNRHLIDIQFTKTADNEWSWEAVDQGGTTVANGTLTFNSDGSFQSATGTTDLTFNPGTGANQITFDLDVSGLTQYAASESSVGYRQNGYEMGYLDTFKIDSAGKVIGVFTNGLTRDIAQIAVANFSNPAGLEKVGETMFRTSSNSGEAQINISGVGGAGRITPGALEMSNVDLSQEF
ncbi:MAG TPA: flagellar hook protein FlgE, partial [Firmicutes bacterium]|nr:flagellar hook protein FlgE [Bacillota bacterium]